MIEADIEAFSWFLRNFLEGLLGDKSSGKNLMLPNKPVGRQP